MSTSYQLLITASNSSVFDDRAHALKLVQWLNKRYSYAAFTVLPGDTSFWYCDYIKNLDCEYLAALLRALRKTDTLSDMFSVMLSVERDPWQFFFNVGHFADEHYEALAIIEKNCSEQGVWVKILPPAVSTASSGLTDTTGSV